MANEWLNDLCERTMRLLLRMLEEDKVFLRYFSLTFVGDGLARVDHVT